jgi:hypothetical protein
LNPVGRVVVGLLVQLAFLALAVYVFVAPDALPGVSQVARAGVAALAVAVAALTGEVSRLRLQMTALLSALQSQLSSHVPRDDRMAVDVLVSALGSKDAAVREKAHKNLLRITKQDLPPDPVAWRTWWQAARASFPVRGE